MNRRMLQTALVAGAFGVVAVAGFAVADEGIGLPGQEAEQTVDDDAIEIEAVDDAASSPDDQADARADEQDDD